MLACEPDNEHWPAERDLDGAASSLRLRRLFALERFAVLATVSDDQPDTFLMAFAASPDQRHLVLVSRRDTHKVEALSANPRVALMIDNCANDPTDTQDAVAVTATGHAIEVRDDEREALLELFLAKHPYLTEFASAASTAVLRIDVAHYRIVMQFENVVTWQPGESTDAGDDSGLPEGAISVVRVGEHAWHFQSPRLTDQAYDRLYIAIEHYWAGEDAAAEAGYRALIREYPEFIDAHHHLALLLSYTGRADEAYEIWYAATQLGLRHLPQPVLEGVDEIPWVMLDNRPFLRAYHALGLEYRVRGAQALALKVWERMLSMNTDDNQGIRALAMDAYLALGKDHDALELAARYPDDILPETLYGRVLAFFRIQQQREAEKALSFAVGILPLVARELAKKRHRRPREFREDRVTIGSPEEAYLYWQDAGHLWKRAPGALDFVRAYLDAHPETPKS